MVSPIALEDIKGFKQINRSITGDERIEIFGALQNRSQKPAAIEWFKNCCRPLFRADDWPLCLTALNGRDEGFSVMYNHGINLNKKQVGKHLKAFSNALGESTILGVCRRTRGILPDAWSICSLRRMGVKFLKSNTPFYKNDHSLLGRIYLPALRVCPQT